MRHPPSSPPTQRPVSPQLLLRRGGILPPGMTPQSSYTPFSYVAQQTQSFTSNTLGKRYASAELQRVSPPRQAPWIPESIEPSLSFHSQMGRGEADQLADKSWLSRPHACSCTGEQELGDSITMTTSWAVPAGILPYFLRLRVASCKPWSF